MKSAFLMSERDVASSDASNISCEVSNVLSLSLFVLPTERT